MVLVQFPCLRVVRYVSMSHYPFGDWPVDFSLPMYIQIILSAVSIHLPHCLLLGPGCALRAPETKVQNTFVLLYQMGRGSTGRSVLRQSKQL